MFTYFEIFWLFAMLILMYLSWLLHCSGRFDRRGKRKRRRIVKYYKSSYTNTEPVVQESVTQEENGKYEVTSVLGLDFRKDDTYIHLKYSDGDIGWAPSKQTEVTYLLCNYLRKFKKTFSK